jgi:hypothetical protein
MSELEMKNEAETEEFADDLSDEIARSGRRGQIQWRWCFLWWR